MTNTTDTNFARDEHDLYGKLLYVLPPTRFPYVCIMGQSSIYARNIKKQMARSVLCHSLMIDSTFEQSENVPITRGVQAAALGLQ